MEGIVKDDVRDWPIHHLAKSGDDLCLEEMAMINSVIYLHQAANGEVPHGGIDLTKVQKEPMREPITMDGEDMMGITDPEAGNE